MFSNGYGFLSNCCRNVLKLSIFYRIVIHLFPSSCQIISICVELFSKLSSIVVELSNCCPNFVELLTNCRCVFELLICFRIVLQLMSNRLQLSPFVVETISYCFRILQLLSKFNHILVKLYNCYRNFGELLLKGRFAIELLSNCS